MTSVAPVFANPSLVRPGGVQTLRVVVNASALYNSKKAGDITWQNPGGTREEILDSWSRFQRDHVNDDMPLNPGFYQVRELLKLNQFARDPMKAPLVRVDLVTRQSYADSKRLLRHIDRDFREHYDKGFRRLSFRDGENPIPHIIKHGAHFYLSGDPYWALEAIKAGISGIYMLPDAPEKKRPDLPLLWSFDGDGVLVSDEAEIEFQQGIKEGGFLQGLLRFNGHETDKKSDALPDGPLMKGARALADIISQFGDKKDFPVSPLQMALVTARGPATVARIYHTLEQKEMLDAFRFVEHMSGEEKGPFLELMGADFHVDDGLHHNESAMRNGIPAGRVIYGVQNRDFIEALQKERNPV